MQQDRPTYNPAYGSDQEEGCNVRQFHNQLCTSHIAASSQLVSDVINSAFDAINKFWTSIPNNNKAHSFFLVVTKRSGTIEMKFVKCRRPPMLYSIGSGAFGCDSFGRAARKLRLLRLFETPFVLLNRTDSHRSWTQTRDSLQA